MQAIMTKYLGPTNNRGSRIKAYTESGLSITIPYPHERNQGADAHSVAALALAKRAGWTGDLIAGATDRGYVFVFRHGPLYRSITTQDDIDAAIDRMQAKLSSI